METHGTTIILVMALICHAICAPQVKAVNKNTGAITSPANITFEELTYIIRARNGEDQRLPKHLSPCARAILGCCKDNIMNSNCSESLKCGAFFFDDNPCDDKFIVDALKAAKSFYEQLNDVTK